MMECFEVGTRWLLRLLILSAVLWALMFLRLLVLRRQLIALLGGVSGWAAGAKGLEMSRGQQLVRCAHIIATARDERLRSQKVAEAARLLEMLR